MKTERGTFTWAVHMVYQKHSKCNHSELNALCGTERRNSRFFPGAHTRPQFPMRALRDRAVELKRLHNKAIIVR